MKGILAQFLDSRSGKGYAFAGMRVDLHVHTRESSSPPEHWFGRLFGMQECYLQPEEVPLEAARKGLDAVAITNHDSANDALSLAHSHPGMVIPGCEYTVYAGRGRYVHVVVLGLDERIHARLLHERPRGVKRFAGLARRVGLPFFLAHPAWEVGGTKTGLRADLLCEWVKYFDLVEVLNGTCHVENEVAQGLARYFRKARVGGSDAHDVTAIGTAWTEGEASTLEEFMECLREGEVRPGGRAVSSGKLTTTAREVAGAFYRRELLKAVGAGSVGGYLSKSSLVELLRVAAEALILPGLLWAAQAQSGTYLQNLEEKAKRLRRELVDFLLLDLAGKLSKQELGEKERRRTLVAGIREVYSAFGGI